MPTTKFQSSLPGLPIPKLEATLTRYLASQGAILTADQHKQTTRLVDQFR